MPDQLKPCPFCGAPGEIAGDDAPENWARCTASCQPMGHNKDKIARAWNTRAESAEVENWRDHVEQRLRTWRQRAMNKSGDRLALDDLMGQECIDDLIDYVCDEWAFPPQNTKKESAEVERLRARVAELEAAQAWRPIEEAPLDRTLVLLGGGVWGDDFLEKQPTPMVARWEERGAAHKRGWIIAALEGGYSQCRYHEPTHWMPLPKGPE